MTQEQSAAAGAPSFTVKGQYIKDLSFENPHAPQSLMAAGVKPAIEVNVDLKAQKLQDNVYEMTLHLAARANAEGNTLFLAELAYAGIFQIANIPAERLEQVILVDCPFVLFPFARRVIADVTRDGGFPPLMLDPIDFQALYIQNNNKKEAVNS
ncbi:MAG: protein-export chaperone SecB [Alphaproteobacteria bacterium]|nr:protein-export chaperone SecB [Alphaproteobacteria bacterium]